MSKLYPIGTILTTHRLSQYTLYCKVFCNNDLGSKELDVTMLAAGFSYLGVKFQVEVTTENQAYLSPVPMDGDVIEKRTYPNGMRAPLIEWDEVREPQEIK